MGTLRRASDLLDADHRSARTGACNPDRRDWPAARTGIRGMVDGFTVWLGD